MHTHVRISRFVYLSVLDLNADIDGGIDNMSILDVYNSFKFPTVFFPFCISGFAVESF